MSDYATLFGGSKPTKLWVSGGTYKAEEFVISPTNSHPYMRKTNGAGATDPCNDKTNWRLIGPGGIKSIQRGNTFASNSSSVTIAAVDIANSVVTFLGQSFSSASTELTARIFLESPTVLRVLRASNTASNVIVSWEVIEYWS